MLPSRRSIPKQITLNGSGRFCHVNFQASRIDLHFLKRAPVFDFCRIVDVESLFVVLRQDIGAGDEKREAKRLIR